MRAWQERLSEDDRTALRVFRSLTRPGVQELGLVPVVFEVEGLTMTRPEARGLLARLAVLYEHARSQAAAARSGGDDGG